MLEYYLIGELETLSRKVLRWVESYIFRIIGQYTVAMILSAISDNFLTVVIHADNEWNVEIAKSEAQHRSQTVGRRPPDFGRGSTFMVDMA